MKRILSNWNELLHRSYAPYSNSSEICIVIDSDQKAHPGVRVENAAFPDTISAYQSAVYGCIAAGKTPKELWVKTEEQTNNWQCIYLSEMYDLPIIVKETFENIEEFNPFKHFDSLKIQPLKDLIPTAVTPNSDFKVASYLQTEYGFIAGVNIENNDWRFGLCAERVALSRAKSYGVQSLGEMHVFASKADYCSPCGACRQVLIEHIPDSKMYLYHADETHSEIIMKYLLPHSFMSSNLKKN